MNEPSCPPDCGKCCDPVVTTVAPNEIAITDPRMTDDQMADRRFMFDHFTPVPRREGLRRASYLSDGGHTVLLVADQVSGLTFIVDAWSHFYDCDRFDPVTRRCSDYAGRPPMCRDYPLYGDRIDSADHARKRLPDGCVYRPDAPVPVKVLPPKAKRRGR